MQLLFCAGKYHNQKQLKEKRVSKKRVRDCGDGLVEHGSRNGKLCFIGKQEQRKRTGSGMRPYILKNFP